MDEKDQERLRLLLELFPNAAAQLRGALGNIEFAVSRIVPPEARDFNREMDRNAALLYQSYYRLLRLVNNFSDAPFLLDNKPLDLVDRDLTVLVGDVCRKAEAMAELRGLYLEFESQLPEGHLVAVHPQGIERLLLNLLSNAFKFTPAGGSVRVGLQKVGERILLTVTDTGCGISEELLPTLFDRCLHTERRDPAPHGLGLGLPICQGIARAHGGQMMAVSAPGKGTRMTLSLPDRRSDHPVISDLSFDYAGGFDRVLLELSDALPMEAFLQRRTD